jgi:vitamin B12 transporter
MTSPTPEALSTPELDVPAVQGVQDETFPSLVISATRYEMPQSQVSSDITVITKEEIAHLPVHDLSEALNYVTGLDLQRGGGPGTPASPSIQGSDFRHVKILIDGMPIENLSESFPDLSILPLENIERIEVMKGSASSVWGSSLGGVINIIMKEPSDKLTAEGGVSLGENSTNSYKAGLSGQAGGVGYFLSLSRFETDGFHDFQEAENNYLYAKLTKDINPHLKATATYSFSDINREDSGWEWEEDSFEQRVALALDYKPKEKLEYTLLVYDRQYNVRTEGPFSGTMRDVENIYGGTFSSVWRHSEDGAFSIGAEASHGDLKLNQMAGWEDFDVEKTALFANEVFGLGRLSLNAGVRYDNDSVFGSETSPSAGIVYDAGHSTLFRLNAARGFSAPSVTYRNASYVVKQDGDLNAERAWTYQAGVESGAIKGLHMKLGLYRPCDDG